ncbi:MAG: D-aminoacyl-tRNA deacylase, partial [Leptotrichiaceae bacterium]|nr:D-aminoacyl-tRNA deacylase [Leptotrichiaceae bacterium]
VADSRSVRAAMSPHGEKVVDKIYKKHILCKYNFNYRKGFMKIIIQRVNKAKMFVNGYFKCEIGKGIVAYIGITHNDGIKDTNYCVDKLINLRIFDDSDGKMNLSVQDIKGELLIVSNFTVYGNTKKGRRPDYLNSAPAEKAKEIYNLFLEKLSDTGISFGTGEFQEHMEIYSENDGPVNLIIES